MVRLRDLEPSVREALERKMRHRALAEKAIKKLEWQKFCWKVFPHLRPKADVNEELPKV